MPFNPTIRVRITSADYVSPFERDSQHDAELIPHGGNYDDAFQCRFADGSIIRGNHCKVILDEKHFLLFKKGTDPAGTKPTNPKDAIGSTKLPFHVLPLRVLAGIILAFLGGALKYGSHNYRKAGVRATVYIDGAMRHIVRFAEGEDWDPDVVGYDKGVRIHHIDEAIAGLWVLRDSILRGNWTDDRAPFSDPVWLDEANRMSALIISCNPNPVPPVTEASLRAESSPPAPSPTAHAGDDTPARVETTISPTPEPIPEGVTYKGNGAFADEVFMRGDTCIDDYDNPAGFWHIWRERCEEFPHNLGGVGPPGVPKGAG